MVQRRRSNQSELLVRSRITAARSSSRDRHSFHRHEWWMQLRRTGSVGSTDRTIRLGDHLDVRVDDAATAFLVTADDEVVTDADTDSCNQPTGVRLEGAAVHSYRSDPQASELHLRGIRITTADAVPHPRRHHSDLRRATEPGPAEATTTAPRARVPAAASTDT